MLKFQFLSWSLLQTGNIFTNNLLNNGIYTFFLFWLKFIYVENYITHKK